MRHEDTSKSSGMRQYRFLYCLCISGSAGVALHNAFLILPAGAATGGMLSLF